MKTRKPRAVSAFTIAEILVATGLFGAVGLAMFSLLNVGMTLFARNVSVNMAHQQARNGMSRVVRDLHQSVSIPQLIDANFNQINTAGPAAGVSFQIITSGPYQIQNDPANPALTQISTPDPKPATPSIGDHLVVLDYNIETDIINITANGNGSNHWNVFLLNGNEKKIQTKSGSFVVCYVTRRVAYVVANGELRFYPNLVATPATYAVVARNFTSATPFSMALTNGTPDSRYININMTTTDPTYSNRNYKSTSMEVIDANTPYRQQLTVYQ